MNVAMRCFGLAILAAIPTQAQTTTTAGLGWLISQSDLALVGTVTNHTFAGNRFQFVVAADRVLKGGGPGAYTITASGVTPSRVKALQAAASRGNLPHPRALMFARRAGPDWELVGRPDSEFRTEYFVFELPRQYVAPARRSSDTVEDSIVRIFAAHIAALPKSRGLGYPEGAFLSFARHTRENPGAALQDAIREFLSSPNQDLQALGIRSKVCLNDLAAPALVESALGMLDRVRGAEVLETFRNWYQSDDVLSVRAVVRVLNATRDENLQEACVRVLSRGHIRAALPALAAALESPNVKTRFWAVRGLSAFANNLGSSNPGSWRYRTEETMKRTSVSAEQLAGNVQFWRAWWDRYKKELTEE